MENVAAAGEGRAPVAEFNILREMIRLNPELDFRDRRFSFDANEHP